MFGVGVVELLLLNVLWVVPFALAYVMIRLAVRHGVMDAHDRMAGRQRPTEPARPAAVSGDGRP